MCVTFDPTGAEMAQLKACRQASIPTTSTNNQRSRLAGGFGALGNQGDSDLNAMLN